jgi:hypothetical protein
MGLSRVGGESVLLPNGDVIVSGGAQVCTKVTLVVHDRSHSACIRSNRHCRKCYYLTPSRSHLTDRLHGRHSE